MECFNRMIYYRKVAHVGDIKYYLKKMESKTLAKKKISVLNYAFNKPYSMKFIRPAKPIGLAIFEIVARICSILLGLSLLAFCVEHSIMLIRERYTNFRNIACCIVKFKQV